ncbi:MAG: hypothetical protein COA54_09375 [Thiotrichaceae bacterium]|nr:MAG: hypothetical protein COA54_09375 [Thiotrichaceae bacterium]
MDNRGGARTLHAGPWWSYPVLPGSGPDFETESISEARGTRRLRVPGPVLAIDQGPRNQAWVRSGLNASIEVVPIAATAVIGGRIAGGALDGGALRGTLDAQGSALERGGLGLVAVEQQPVLVVQDVLGHYVESAGPSCRGDSGAGDQGQAALGVELGRAVGDGRLVGEVVDGVRVEAVAWALVAEHDRLAEGVPREAGANLAPTRLRVHGELGADGLLLCVVAVGSDVPGAGRPVRPGDREVAGGVRDDPGLPLVARTRLVDLERGAEGGARGAEAASVDVPVGALTVRGALPDDDEPTGSVRRGAGLALVEGRVVEAGACAQGQLVLCGHQRHAVLVEQAREEVRARPDSGARVVHEHHEHGSVGSDGGSGVRLAAVADRIDVDVAGQECAVRVDDAKDRVAVVTSRPGDDPAARGALRDQGAPL